VLAFVVLTSIVVSGWRKKDKKRLLGILKERSPRFLENYLYTVGIKESKERFGSVVIQEFSSAKQFKYIMKSVCIRSFMIIGMLGATLLCFVSLSIFFRLSAYFFTNIDVAFVVGLFSFVIIILISFALHISGKNDFILSFFVNLVILAVSAIMRRKFWKLMEANKSSTTECIKTYISKYPNAFWISDEIRIVVKN